MADGASTSSRVALVALCHSLHCAVAEHMAYCILQYHIVADWQWMGAISKCGGCLVPGACYMSS